jgi:hypothetical protein
MSFVMTSATRASSSFGARGHRLQSVAFGDDPDQVVTFGRAPSF